MSEQRTLGGHFLIVSELSSGGFGETFLAEDVRFHEKPKCVVKHLKPQSDDPEINKLSKRLFEQEVNILYKLGEHPQIPSIIAHFEENQEFYFVQEYVEGNTFAQEISRGTIYSQRQVFEIIADLLDVLAFVHSRGVIHRDVKPANLIHRKSDGKIVLIDFGAVKQVGNQTANNPNQTTQATIAIGSEGYMPMEQLAGHPRFSSDVYAVGMFAIHLLTQTHPTKLRQSQRTGEWIWQDKATVSVQLAEFINHMIRYDFRQRFADAVEALNHLRRLNLNFGGFENNRRNANFAVNNSEFGVTQATNFAPVEVNSGSYGNYAPQFDLPPLANETAYNQPQFIPQFEQKPQPLHPNLQKYSRRSKTSSEPPENSQNPMATRLNTGLHNDTTRVVLPESVSLGGSTFDFFKESGVAKPLYFVFAIFAGLVILGSSFSVINRNYSESYTPTAAPQMPYPNVKTQRSAPPKETSGYKTSALQKEGKAITGDDWYEAANEWKKAEEYYAKLESLATNDSDRESAASDKTFCENKKMSALQRSQTTRRKY